MRMVLSTLVLSCLLLHSAKADELRTATVIEKGLGFLEETGTAFAKKKSCITCHHSPFLAWARTEALRSGFEVDAKVADKTTDETLQKLLKRKDSYKSKQWTHTLATFYFMSQVDQAQLSRRQAVFDQLAQAIVETQHESGSWRAAGQFTGQRRPKNEAHQVQTMWTLLALSKFESNDKKISEALQSASSWLGQQENVESIDARVLRLLLDKRNNNQDRFGKDLAQLAEAQNDDGGWGWQAGDPSDAWATGMVLYAGSLLGDSELSNTLAGGRKFLESSQRDDGSWLVPTKLNSKNGKEHGSEISSFFGSVWAVIGLCRMSEDIPVKDADKTTQLD